MSLLTVKKRDRAGGIVIFDCSGRLTVGENVKVLREVVRASVNEDKKFLILNLAEVSYIDGDGLGELVSTYVMVKSKSGDLKLVSLSAKTRLASDDKITNSFRHI